jgi:hypothetical protein
LLNTLEASSLKVVAKNYFILADRIINPHPPIEDMAPCKSEPKMEEFPWEGTNFKANLRKFQRVGKKNE